MKKKKRDKSNVGSGEGGIKCGKWEEIMRRRENILNFSMLIRKDLGGEKKDVPSD